MFKRTTNTKGYSDTHAALTEALQDSDQAPPHCDAVWVEATEKQAQLKDLYEQELNQAKVQGVKEQVRSCLMQLANLCMEQGDYVAAAKFMAKSREYCTEPKAVFNVCMSIIKFSSLLRQYMDIQSYTSKAHHMPGKEEAGQSKIFAAYGLYYMTCGKYKDAAGSFTQVRREDLGQAFSDVLCPQDIAVYGALCALASMDRAQVQAKLLDKSSFRECLDMVPQIRDITIDFCSCKYAACLSALERLRPSLSLDVHLHGQVDELCQQIRSKGIVQYFVPFMSVSLHTMAAAFNTDVDGMQKEAARLVGKGHLDARIDSHTKVLHVRHSNQRRATYGNAMRVSQDFLDSTQALILRMNLLKHDFGVHLVRQKK